MLCFSKNNSACVRQFFAPLLVMVLVFTLYACGFQLRGSIALSSDMAPVYLQQNSAFDLAREIKSLLLTNNIKTVDQASQSKSQLILLSDEKTRRVLSVDGSGQAREYLLIYTVRFEIKIENSAIVADDNNPNLSHDTNNQGSISVQRSLLFDTGAVLAVTNEAEILYKDMRRDAARLILLKLQARSNSGSKTTSNSGAKSK